MLVGHTSVVAGNCEKIVGFIEIYWCFILKSVHFKKTVAQFSFLLKL